MKKSGYWTKEKCKEEALKYKKRSDFSKNAKGAYMASCKNNWINEICEHMPKVVEKWNKDRCQIVINKCTTLEQFRNEYNSAYQSCVRNNWIDELCSELHRKFKTPGYWTKERCLESALKCETKREFKEKYISAYTKSIENNWYSYIIDKCNFTNTNKNYEWIVYSYILLNKYVYVGITKNEHNRKLNHLKNSKNSPVLRFINENNINAIDIIYNKEIGNIKSKKEIQKLEKYYLDKYINMGYSKLNVKKTGGVGGNELLWTKEKCQEYALKCKTKIDFIKRFPSAYGSARRNKWINDICNHMVSLRKPNGYWTKEKCYEESLKYKCKSDFQKSQHAYKKSIINKWIDEFYPSKYTKENCLKIALKYKTKIDFLNNDRNTYNLAYDHDWLSDICAHMTKKTNKYDKSK